MVLRRMCFHYYMPPKEEEMLVAFFDKNFFHERKPNSWEDI
jgi:hypothetical protein